MSKFKVGDRVRIRQWEDMESGHKKDAVGNIDLGGIIFNRSMIHLCGQTAQITRICGNAINLDGWSGKGDHGWAYTFDMIEPAEDRKILITASGPTTLARLYEGKKVVKSAKAVCSPEDTFDFEVGAQLAYDRLMGEEKAKEEPRPEPVKLYCVKDWNPGKIFTRGEVYNFVPGQGVAYDDGWVGGDTYGGRYAKYAMENPGLSSCLVPLVSRPAKVGEFVYVIAATEHHGAYTNGDVLKVVKVNDGRPLKVNGIYVESKTGETNCGNETFLFHNEYLVLDGYHPEPETCKCCGQVISK